MRPHRTTVASIAIASTVLTARAPAAQEAAAPAPARAVRLDARAEAARAANGRRIEAVLDGQMQVLETLLERIPEDLAGEARPGAPRAARPFLNDRTLNSLVFGAASVGQFRDLLHRQLEQVVAQARRSLSLTRDQERKLRLAGEGDLKRYFDRFDEVRREIVLAGTDASLRKSCLLKIRELKRTRMLGPFAEGSIFAKVRERIRREQEVAGREAR